MRLTVEFYIINHRKYWEEWARSLKALNEFLLTKKKERRDLKDLL